MVRSQRRAVAKHAISPPRADVGHEKCDSGTRRPASGYRPARAHPEGAAEAFILTCECRNTVRWRHDEKGLLGLAGQRHGGQARPARAVAAWPWGLRRNGLRRGGPRRGGPCRGAGNSWAARAGKAGRGSMLCCGVCLSDPVGRGKTRTRRPWCSRRAIVARDLGLSPRRGVALGPGGRPLVP